MFPIPFNFPFRKKDGSITTMDDAISSGGGSYTLPTASADTKGGVKVGAGLTMDGETLKVTGGVVDYEHNIVSYGIVDDYEYYVKLLKRYAGAGSIGYEVVTYTASSSDASIDVYQVIYESGVETDKYLLKHLVYNGDSRYEDDNIKITYNTIAGAKWSIEFSNPMYKLNGDTWTSPVSWLYNETVDNLLFTSDPS